MKLGIATCVVAFGLANGLFATPIIFGSLNITGSVRVSDREIDWQPNGGATGVFDVVIPGSGYFSSLATSPATYTGDSIDLTSPVPVPPLPVGFAIDGFLRNLRLIAGGAPAPAPYNTFQFDLTNIVIPAVALCTGAEAEGASCRQGLFQLTNLGGGQTLIGLRVQGYFEDMGVTCTTPGQANCTAAVGRYSTQLGQSIATIKSTIDGGGSINASYSANFDAVPEPSTVWLGLTGIGLCAAGLYRRRAAAGSLKQ